MSIKIGDVVLKHGIMLAPMAGVTDRAFRKICRDCGAEFTVSEMLSAKALCYEQMSKKENFCSKTAPLAMLGADEYPSAVQIFGCEPSYMAQASAMLESLEYNGCTSQISPSAIDINMGCPVHKIISNGEGSAIMKNPTLAYDIVRAVKNALKRTPVTVKIRAGFSNDKLNAVEVAQAVEEAGASLVCVHARTREQMYTPGINPEIIAEVKNSLKIPVIGNGDVYTANDALKMMSDTGCDGVMIARGARGNPWIFSEILSALEGGEYKSPSLEEKKQTMLLQLSLMIEEKGERVAVAEAKKHIAWYIHGVRDATGMRNRVMGCVSAGELRQIISEIDEA